MDGASKFVRGDAIAAVIIILVNILGGLAIGILQQGMSPGLAAQTYTVLTVGEGLVAQIPALIVSTAAGIVVTRAASETDLGGEMARQLLMSSKAVGIAAGILLALGLVPGLPHAAFLLLGSAVAWIAYHLHQQEQIQAAPTPAPVTAKVEEGMTRVTPLDLMEVQVGYGLIGLVEGTQGTALLDRIKALRRQFAESMGFVVPPIHIRDNLQLRPNEYAIILKGWKLRRPTWCQAISWRLILAPVSEGWCRGLRPKNLRLACQLSGFLMMSSKLKWPVIRWLMRVPPSPHIFPS